MRSLRSLADLMPANTILVPCHSWGMGSIGVGRGSVNMYISWCPVQVEGWFGGGGQVDVPRPRRATNPTHKH